jgi:hypothetical protein
MEMTQEEATKAIHKLVTLDQATGWMGIPCGIAGAYGITMAVTVLLSSFVAWWAIWGRRCHPIIQTRFGFRAIKLGIWPKATTSVQRGSFFTIGWVLSDGHPLEWLETPQAADRAKWVLAHK